VNRQIQLLIITAVVDLSKNQQL